MSVRNRIYLKRNLLEKEILQEFEKFSTANVADCMNRLCAMSPRIKLVSKPSAKSVCAPAYTVKVRAGDNLALHVALTYCNEGDMIVVSNEEESNRALIGEIMMTFLRCTKKVAGIVIDGPIRDIAELGQWDFPIYCTGTTPNGPFKDGPGEVNVPISCGGVVVEAGDIILADADGVVVIPLKEANKVLPLVKEYAKKDQEKVIAARNGLAKRDWVNKLIVEKDFEIIDDVYKG